MPVYEGEIDNIVGIVNTKDLFYLFQRLASVVVFTMRRLSGHRYLKPDEALDNALRLFRKARRPMAASSVMRTIIFLALLPWKTC